MDQSAEAADITKAHLLHLYNEKRSQIEQLMRPRQGTQPETLFQSAVNIATAVWFREIRKSEIDQLTGLMNKKAFLERTQSMLNFIKRRKDGDVFIKIVEIDIDNFKKVNDKYGHQQGDAVLIEIANLLKNSVRSYDVVSRLSGDEFALLIINGDREYNTDIVAQRIKNELSANPSNVFGFEFLAASIGVVGLQPGDGELQAEDLLKRADIAMYNAKKTPGTNVVVWQPNMVMP